MNWAATGRSGGVSTGRYAGLNLATHVGDAQAHVERNRQFAAALLDVTDLCVIDAQHGARIAVATDAGTATGADGVVSTTPRLGLLALAADCVPIVLADPDAQVIAAVHCGWRGLAAGVVPAAITVMRELGALRIRAVTGPCICVDCYPVGEDCIEALRAQLDGRALEASIHRRGAQWHVDVRAGVHAQLEEQGVSARAIRRCTATDTALFSHRADGSTGRQGMIVAL